ncbi:MAG: right-handed parallel beta-helix repeat-containing protein, partial [Kiritimatiellae bacterium]|nr:right-handed parallel beta-helix repeat-containing protein [Kiritimatiellia bacterium]
MMSKRCMAAFGIKCLASMLVMCVLCLSANATNVFVVPPDHPAAAPVFPFTNWITAATNIQEAHDAININDGNIIFITNGQYLLTNQLLVTKGVVLRSWNGGTTDPEGTILDANNTSRVMCISNTVAVLDGLTLQNGNGGAGGNGGGLYAYKALLVTNCIIKNCQGQSYGGGFFMPNNVGAVLGLMTHCQIISNSALIGGGAHLGYGTTGMIEHCTIASNYAGHADPSYGGGGISLMGASTLEPNAVTARWCTITFNTARACGGGVNINYNGGDVENCLIASNYQVRTTGPTRWGSGIYFFKSQATARNCVITCNSNVGNLAAVKMGGGRLENCTVVNNCNGGICDSYTNPSYETGTVVNTISYSNLAYNINATNQIAFTNCCTTIELP